MRRKLRWQLLNLWQYLQQHLWQLVRRDLPRDLRHLRRRQLQCELPRWLPSSHSRLPAAVSQLNSSHSLAPDWRPLYGETRSREIRALALEIARRLIDPGTVEKAVVSARAQSQEPQAIYWRSYAVAQGDAGIALMYGYFDRCFPDEGWDRVAHQWIERAGAGLESAHPPGGLFEGLSGLAFTVGYLSRDGRRYRSLLSSLHDYIVEHSQSECDRLESALGDGSVAFGALDAISGLTGIGVYLLGRRDRTALTPVLGCLVKLAGGADGLPRWRTPPELSGDWMRTEFPDGHLNCGLAHGIPGLLALLSMARLDGVDCPGLDEAIDEIAIWLSRHTIADAFGVNWPTAIPLSRRGDQLVVTDCAGLHGARAGWCYGSPGVARSLWLAGRARNDAAYASVAIEAMRAVLRRPVQSRGLSSPTFCHGLAGLLCIALRFNDETTTAEFVPLGRQLVRQIEDLFEPETILGYRTSEPGGSRIDQAGLLDGAPGVAMALLAAATSCPPSWDRLFLLS